MRSQREERKECRTLTRTLQVGGATTTTARLATRTRTGQPTSIQNPSLIFHVLALLPPQAADRATAPRAHLRSAESFAAVSGSAGSATEVKTSRSKGAAAHWDGSGSDGAADAGAAGAGESTGDGEGGARDGLDASLQTLLEGGARLLVELDAAGLAEPLEASLLQGRSSLSRALRQIASPLCAAGAADGRASHGDGDDRDAQLLSTNEHLRALLEDGAQLLASLEEAGAAAPCLEETACGEAAGSGPAVAASTAAVPERTLSAPSLAAEPAQPAVAATAAEGASRAEAHSVQVHSGQVAELAQEVWVQLSYEHKVLTLPLLSPARARALCVPVSPRLLSRSLPDAAVPADALAYTIAY